MEEDRQEEEEAPQLCQVYLHPAPGLQVVEEVEEDCQEEEEDHLSLQQEQQEQRLAKVTN